MTDRKLDERLWLIVPLLIEVWGLAMKFPALFTSMSTLLTVGAEQSIQIRGF